MVRPPVGTYGCRSCSLFLGHDCIALHCLNVPQVVYLPFSEYISVCIQNSEFHWYETHCFLASSSSPMLDSWKYRLGHRPSIASASTNHQIVLQYWVSFPPSSIAHPDPQPSTTDDFHFGPNVGYGEELSGFSLCFPGDLA